MMCHCVISPFFSMSSKTLAVTGKQKQQLKNSGILMEYWCGLVLDGVLINKY